MTELKRAVIEVFGGCNYTCQMCPQALPGRDASFKRKMPLDMFEDILDQISPKYGTPIINLEGSGEPTMAKDLPLYIEACTRRGLKSFIYCNGSKLQGQFMQDCIDAQLDFLRVSCIGYNREKYQKWMNCDNFELLKRNVKETVDYVDQSNSKCVVSSYHLITDNSQLDYEIEQYRTNFIDDLGIVGYIWKMHNWSGNYSPEYGRNTKVKKSCDRPNAPEITVRAGGLDGKFGAVTPCCQTMGPPNETKSVLGHFQDQSFEEIYWGDAYNNLRDAHKRGDFDSVDYCKNCDFLYEDPEVLVWSNDPESSTDYMLGSGFSLKDYK